jgi:hypothetical protein
VSSVAGLFPPQGAFTRFSRLLRESSLDAAVMPNEAHWGDAEFDAPPIERVDLPETFPNG